MNPGSQVNHPIRGSGSRLSASTLDSRVRVRRAIDAGNPGRDKMRDNKNKSHRDRTGREVANAVADSPVYTVEERQTMRVGLRILARIIARAHLRRQAELSSAPAPSPPPAGESRD